MRFVQFTEYSEHEGETWRFWLQTTGNEAELEKLQALLAREEAEQEADPAYELDTEFTPEAEVDVLVKHSMAGYMEYEHKVTGQFACPEYEPGLGSLYKGKIKRCFR